MLKYRLVFVIVFYFLTTGTGRCQTPDSVGNLPDSEDRFIAPLTQNVNIPETLREVPQQRIDKYLNDPAYAYANDSTYWRDDPPPKAGPISRFLSGKTFQWIFFLAMVAVVLFGIYRLARENNVNGFFGRRTKPAHTAGGETGHDEFENFDMLISKYQSEGNYRSAIRYLYLRLIRTAIENRNIRIGESSTNAVIAKSFDNKKEAADFKYLASAFEYVFYGGFSPAYPVYENLKSKFDQFQQTLIN